MEKFFLQQFRRHLWVTLEMRPSQEGDELGLVDLSIVKNIRRETLVIPVFI